MSQDLKRHRPHSAESERAVLAAVLLRPELLADLDLTAADFYLDRHQWIFETYGDLAAAGEPIDLRTVQARLEQRGEFARVGGLAYLAGLEVDLPDLGRLDTYAAIVRERALRRRLLETAERLEHQAGATDLEAATIVEAARRELERLELPGARRASPWAAELVGEVLAAAEARREERLRSGRVVLGLATGIPRLDGLLSGLQRGLYLLAGAPGVGKTTLSFQLALHAAREVPVVYVTFENSAASLLTKALCTAADRNSQDVARGFLGAEDLAPAAEELAASLSRLLLVDGDGRLTVTELRALARRALTQHETTRCLVVVDYLQLWAKTSRELRGLADTRARVDALGGELIDLARRLDAPVLALSSQSRVGGAYGRGGGEAALDSLKESGDLEYAADVALFLTAAKERTAQPPLRAVDLTIGKNRHGPTGMVPLLYRPDRGWLREEAAG